MNELRRTVSVIVYNNDGSILTYTIPRYAIPTDNIGSIYTKDKYGNWVADNRTSTK